MMKALCLTVSIEGILGLFLYGFWKDTMQVKEEILYNALINMITNPLLNLILQVTGVHVFFVCLGEGAVIIVEALLYVLLGRMNGKKALLYSLFLNLVSFGIGEVLI